MSLPADYDRQIDDLRKYAEKNGIPWEQVEPKSLGERMQEQNKAWMKKLIDERKSHGDGSSEEQTSGFAANSPDNVEPTKEEIMEGFGITEEEYYEYFG